MPALLPSLSLPSYVNFHPPAQAPDVAAGSQGVRTLLTSRQDIAKAPITDGWRLALRAQMKTWYFLLWLAIVPAMAQTRLLTFGLEGGMPAQTPFGETGDQMPFFLGPKMNVRILRRLSFETGVSFHGIGNDLTLVSFIS